VRRSTFVQRFIMHACALDVSMVVLWRSYGRALVVLWLFYGCSAAVLRVFSGCAHTRGRYHALRRSQLQGSAGRMQDSSEHSQAGVRGRETGV
jgi:hypothetical protein